MSRKGRNAGRSAVIPRIISEPPSSTTHVQMKFPPIKAHAAKQNAVVRAQAGSVLPQQKHLLCGAPHVPGGQGAEVSHRPALPNCLRPSLAEPFGHFRMIPRTTE